MLLKQHQELNLVVTPSDLFKFNISMFNASDLYADFNVEDFTRSRRSSNDASFI